MSTLQLLVADGHRLSAWIARPKGRPRGAVGACHACAAGHGFNCGERADFDATSAHLAF